MILWHPRQRSTDGRPAYSERRASAWQYWQSIRYLPAWMRWLKKIGCVGARGAVTIGTTAAARNGGDASERTWRITWRICARSEEHTSELQSRGHLVCRLLL